MFSNIIKSVTITRSKILQDKYGVHHIFLWFISGTIVHIEPSTGRGHRINIQGIYGEQAYGAVTYSKTNNCWYFHDFYGKTMKFNSESGQVKLLSYDSAGTYSNLFYTSRTRRQAYVIYPSTDGHVYFGGVGFDRIPGLIKIDADTDEVTVISLSADIEIDHLVGRGALTAVEIDGTFAGVYADYVFNNAFSYIGTTIASEATGSGITLTGSYWLHTGDREVGSATRRIFGFIDGSFKFMDIKSPSTYVDSTITSGTISNAYTTGVWEDQAATPVSDAGWSAVSDLETLGDLDIASWSPGQFFDTYWQIGRYVYQGFGAYMVNGGQRPVYGIRMDTGTAVYTESFNKVSGFIDNYTGDEKTYLCNFGGVQGFSSDDEYVFFFKALNGDYGYIRPDTHTFTAYNPVTNPSSYVLAEVDLLDPTDPNGLGFYYDAAQSNVAEFTASDLQVYMKAAALRCGYLQEIIAEIDPDHPYADITVTTLSDCNYPVTAKTFNFDKVVTYAGVLNRAIEIDTDIIFVVGNRYSGATTIDISTDPYTRLDYLGETPISPDGVLWDGANEVLIYGYSDKCHLVDVADPSDLSKTVVGYVGGMREALYAAYVDSQWILLGEDVRGLSYRNTLYLSYIKTGVNTAIDSVLPYTLNPLLGAVIRQNANLTVSAYDDEDAESALQNYMNIYGKLRSEALDDFIETSRYIGRDVGVSATRIYVGLAYNGISGLKGIRFETTPGSGTWIDHTYQADTRPKLLVLTNTDLDTLSSGDVELISIETADTVGLTDLGRVGVSTNYVFWLRNDPANSRVSVYIAAKSDIETAISGSGILSTLDVRHISTNSSSSSYGWGEANLYVAQNGQQFNFFQVVGDKVYATMISNVAGNPAVYEIDLSAKTTTVFATLASGAKSISITGDRMLVCTGTVMYEIDGYTGVSIPYAIT